MAEGFEGRSLVVTGAGGNLGRAVVDLLLQRGARVLAVVRKPQEVASFAGEGYGPALFRAVVAELGDEAQVEAAFAAAAVLGPLWGLVNAAGAWDGGKPVAATALASFDKMIDANLRSAFVTSRAAMQRLVPAGGGRIVLVSAFIAQTGAGGANNAAYAASKAGVIALTRALAEEGAQSGVHASCLAPGTIRTPSNERAMPAADAAKWVPLTQVAEAAALLCAPGPLAINGAVVTLPSR